MTDTPNHAEDFDSAKAVIDALKTLSKPRQERVLRWVSESLGIEVRLATSGTGPTQLFPSLPPTPGLPAPQQQDSNSAVDIASFIRSKAPSSDVQFVTVVAFYYCFKAAEAERRATIDAELAQNATRLGGWDRLTNPLKALNNAKSRGYLDSAGRGEFRINTVGENLVDRKLPLSASTERRAPKSSQRVGASKSRTRSKRKS